MQATRYSNGHDATASSQEITGAREVAILVAANHLRAAEALLRATIAHPEGREDEQAWLMLLELLCLEGRREEFETLLEAYRDAHGSQGPSWDPAQPVDAPGTYALKGVIGGRPEELDDLRRFAGARRTMVIDLGRVVRIEYAALHAFQLLFSQLAAGGKRMILSNVSELTAALLQAVGLDRHAVIMRRKVSEARLAGLTSRPPLRCVASREAGERVPLAA